jgi:hypothetical protein
MRFPIGPGAYGVPDARLEEKRKNKPGKVPLFERSKGPRSLPYVVIYLYESYLLYM